MIDCLRRHRTVFRSELFFIYTLIFSTSSLVPQLQLLRSLQILQCFHRQPQLLNRITFPSLQVLHPALHLNLNLLTLIHPIASRMLTMSGILSRHQEPTAGMAVFPLELSPGQRLQLHAYSWLLVSFQNVETVLNHRNP